LGNERNASKAYDFEKKLSRDQNTLSIKKKKKKNPSTRHTLSIVPVKEKRMKGRGNVLNTLPTISKTLYRVGLGLHVPLYTTGLWLHN